MNEFSQIFETVNFGLILLDTELKVTHWNHWMATHSGIEADRITGAHLFDFFPELNTDRFLRNIRDVLSFGHFSFFSHKPHPYIFAFKPADAFQSMFAHMQQNCTMGPLRGNDNAIDGIFLIVQDATELASYEHQLIEMNIKDALTGIFNRKFLQTRVNEEYQRHRRYGIKLSLVMFGIDLFEKINDGHGRICADAVLEAVAAKIASIVRQSDCLSRYDEAQFCCLLPETALAGAVVLAERFRQVVESHETRCHEKSLKVTISLGVCELAAEDTVESFLKRADEALFQARSTGRNRVVALPKVDGTTGLS